MSNNRDPQAGIRFPISVHCSPNDAKRKKNELKRDNDRASWAIKPKTACPRVAVECSVLLDTIISSAVYVRQFKHNYVFEQGTVKPSAPVGAFVPHQQENSRLTTTCGGTLVLCRVQGQRAQMQ